MDALEIAQRGVFPVAFLGNQDATDFELIELTESPLPVERWPELKARGLAYLGCAGIVEGRPVCALEDLDPSTAKALAAAHTDYILARTTAARMGVHHA